MQIKKRLQINVAVSVLTALAACLVLFPALYRMNEANNSEKIADDIISSVLERDVLRNDYLRNNGARAKEQWFARHEQIGKLLKRASENFRDTEDGKNISGMIEDHESIGNIFSAIVANREKSYLNPEPAPLSREMEDRLLSQLNMRVYAVVIQNHKLLESTRTARVSALRLAGGGVIFALLVLMAAAITNSRTMGRAITARAARLREGAEVIELGDMDHIIDLKGDDEFAEIAESFNAMAATLRGSYRNLENEIEERKRAEKALRESRAKLEAALASMTDAVFISDAEGRFIEFNDAFATFHRFMDKGECAKTFAEYPAFLDVFLPDGSPASLEMWAVPRALRGETVANAEYTLLRKDTGEYWIGSYSFGPIRDKDGVIVGAMVVARDITDRKLAEQTLQLAHDELARLVKERTRELREKEVLLKEIHHRVKNNLQVISSLVGLQADASTDETVREVLRDVTYRVRSMALVHEKLYQSADLASIDFAEYTRGLLGYLWRAHGAAAAAVRLNLDLSPLSLPVDTAVPCGLILNELAGNALKHAFRGRSEGEVTVSLMSCADGRISLSVSDNGVGLPAGLDWRQASTLGLRLVQMLAGQLGAEVKVSGEEWTRFEISFEVSRGAAESAEKPEKINL
jgi:two-component sensor histidine kinase/HAMP domain-containing protein